MKKKKLLWVIIPIAFIVSLLSAFFIYAEVYYKADETAIAAMESDESVAVSKTDYGWLFDGPSEEALIFYPGAKVEAKAYAPLLHGLAKQGLDVCLVEMPFRFAFFGINRASKAMESHQYATWYIGGHSLGGAIASEYASAHSDKLSGIIVFASFPSKAIDENLFEISIYGSNDQVLNRDKVESGKSYAPSRFYEYVIEGGNHAQFGNYGSQNGDGAATISAEEQQGKAIDFILDCLAIENQ